MGYLADAVHQVLEPSARTGADRGRLGTRWDVGARPPAGDAVADARYLTVAGVAGVVEVDPAGSGEGDAAQYNRSLALFLRTSEEWKLHATR